MAQRCGELCVGDMRGSCWEELCVGAVFGELCGRNCVEETASGSCVSFMPCVSDPFTEIFNMLLCGMFQ